MFSTIRIYHFLSEDDDLLCRRLRPVDRRHAVTVVLPRDSRLLPHARALSLPVVERRQNGNEFSLAALREIFSLLRRERPDIVCPHACLAAGIAAVMLGIPVRLRKRRTEVTTPSHAPFPVLNEKQKEEIAASLDLTHEHFVVGISWHPEKRGAATLLAAARLCLSRCPDFRFLLFGDGKERGALEARALSLGVASSVYFLGSAPDTASYYPILDVIVDGSHGARSDASLPRAMRLGLPAVGSDEKILKDGENGLLVPPDEPEALACALLRLYYDRPLYRRMSEAARRYGDEFFARKNAGEKRKTVVKHKNLKKALTKGKGYGILSS